MHSSKLHNLVNLLQGLINDLSGFLVVLLVLIALASIWIFFKVFKSDFEQPD